MANKCTNCGKFFATSDGAKCIKCNVTYHKQCNNLSPDARHNPKWTCKICKGKTTTKITADTRIPDEESDVFVDVDTAHSDTPLLAQEIKLLRTELSSFRSEMSRLSSLVSEFGTKLSCIEERVTKLEAASCAESSLNISQQNKEINDTINVLKNRLNESEQEKLLNDVEITGVTENSGENLLHIVITLAQKIGLTLDERDIVNVQRRGLRRAAGSAGAGGAGGASGAADGASARPRPIVVRLTRRHLRDELLHAARVRRGADTSGTGVGGEPRRFYINEHLTHANRNLFYATRELLGRTKQWRFVWTRGGRIFARLNQTSRLISIRSQEDLDKVFSS
ncbi:unnamed protein product [Colias eurytheme]|nr:unnamed protein product [Colias eurytheme]